MGRGVYGSWTTSWRAANGAGATNLTTRYKTWPSRRRSGPIDGHRPRSTLDWGREGKICDRGLLKRTVCAANSPRVHRWPNNCMTNIQGYTFLNGIHSHVTNARMFEFKSHCIQFEDTTTRTSPPLLDVTPIETRRLPPHAFHPPPPQPAQPCSSAPTPRYPFTLSRRTCLTRDDRTWRIRRTRRRRRRGQALRPPLHPTSFPRLPTVVVVCCDHRCCHGGPPYMTQAWRLRASARACSPPRRQERNAPCVARRPSPSPWLGTPARAIETTGSGDRGCSTVAWLYGIERRALCTWSRGRRRAEGGRGRPREWTRKGASLRLPLAVVSCVGTGVADCDCVGRGGIG